VFSLVPSATVDEGNNWINVSWGPLSMTNPSLTGGTYGNYGGGLPLGNYSLTPASSAINFIPCASFTAAGNCVTAPTGGLPSLTLPNTDFFGHPRPDSRTPARVDAGAVELPGN
jgi:hypothetical protein